MQQIMSDISRGSSLLEPEQRKSLGGSPYEKKAGFFVLAALAVVSLILAVQIRSLKNRHAYNKGAPYLPSVDFHYVEDVGYIYRDFTYQNDIRVFIFEDICADGEDSINADQCSPLDVCPQNYFCVCGFAVKLYYYDGSSYANDDDIWKWQAEKNRDVLVVKDSCSKHTFCYDPTSSVIYCSFGLYPNADFFLYQCKVRSTFDRPFRGRLGKRLLIRG
jgi:hypothetical protein